MLRISAVAVPFLCAVSLSAAQSSCLDRTVPVSLTERDLTPPPQLAAANLKGTVKGKAVTVKLLQTPRSLPRMIFLIDTSGSMYKSGTATADIAEGILSKLPAEVEVGLAFFNDNATAVSYPRKDRTKVTSAIEALRTGHQTKGRSAIWSAIAESVKMFGTPRPGDSIYLISDGGDNKSKIYESDMEELLGRSGIRLFATFLGQPVGIRIRNLEESAGPENLYAAARSTGGSLITDGESLGISEEGASLINKNGKPTILGLEIVRQLQQVFTVYLVEIGLPEPINKPQDWKLELALPNESDANKLDLLYPKKLYQCP